MVKSPLFPALLLLLYMEAYGFRRLFFDNLIKQTDTFVIQRATGTVRHDLFHKGKRATHAVIRERPLEKSLCHDLYSQNNDTPAWCGSAHRNGNG